MRRLASILSLLLSLAAAVAWATSYGSAPWRLIGTAHSADLARVDGELHTALFTTTPEWATAAPNHGFWDAWWVRSHSGRLSLLAQVVDYEGTLQRVFASPPSLVVERASDPPARLEVFGLQRDVERTTTALGFAFHADAAPAGAVGDVGAAVSARAWLVTLPYWFVLLVGVPLPLLWWRSRRRARGAI